MEILGDPVEFEWDKGNQNKNLKLHGVSDQECEEVFFDSQRQMLKDIVHSGSEERHLLIGKTKKERLLFVAFTLRQHKVRVISARDLNRKEKFLYEKTINGSKIQG